MFTIALTPGCPSGIGPEVFAKALQLLPALPDVEFHWCGPPGPSPHPGKPDGNDLVQQRAALIQAATLAQAGKVQAIVTGPVRKEALYLNGIQFKGQTELLHHFLAADADPPLMYFAGGDFVLGLATVHEPLAHVAHQLTISRIIAALKRLHVASKGGRITVLGLNPHAGEHGLLGREEIDIIGPAIDQGRKLGIHATGPVSADGFFGHYKSLPKAEQPAAVLAMYHDQGLCPYKFAYADQLVNVTLGLRVPRTSPAHGTADDIAGKGIANPSSMLAALKMAVQLCRV